jgi:hypothetical protein
MAFIRRTPIGVLVNRTQQLGMLGKNWIWKPLWLPDRLQAGQGSLRFGQKAMQRNIEPEI